MHNINISKHELELLINLISQRIDTINESDYINNDEDVLMELHTKLTISYITTFK